MIHEKFILLAARQLGLPLPEMEKMPQHLQKNKHVAPVIAAYRRACERVAVLMDTR